MFATLSDDIEAACLEFCGTVLFLLIGLGGIQGVSAASSVGPEASSVEKVLYISVVSVTPSTGISNKRSLSLVRPWGSAC
jgi:hypothetical protein